MEIINHSRLSMIRKLFLRGSLFSYIIQRVIQAIPSVLVVVTIGFLLINLAPGDPVNYLLGDTSDPELAAQIRSRLGLDAPLQVRYITYINGIIHGELGRSLIYNRPVSQLILSRLPATLLLFISQYILSTIIGIMAGAFAAYKKGSFWDKATIFSSVLFISIPVFWSGQLLLIFFALKLPWFPSYGMMDQASQLVGFQHILDIAHHLALPALTLAFFNLALVSRLTRSSMAENLQADYIITARAKGISESVVLIKHALHNAILPVITVLGLTLGRMMSGAVLVETVFSWPGLGRLMYDSITMRDYPVVLGMFIVISCTVIAANLLTDLFYAIIDPRIKYR
jgi:ABC-type dipeptide/oligopeptide/nickel transport system permease component